MIKSLFNEYKSFTGFRFLVAGMINTLFGFTLSILLLVTLPFHYAFTLFLSTVLAVCFNYFMSSKFVFRTKISLKKTFLYFLMYLIMYLMNLFLMYILINQFNLNDIIAFITCAPIIIGLTYLSQKYIVFRYEKNISHNSNL
jgi:putative flippase GtrA